MSRLPPISRGGSVPSPSAAAAGTAGGESSDRSSPTRLANSSSRRRTCSISSRDGATPIVPGNGSPGIAIPGSSADRACRPSSSQRDEVGTGEDVGEEAETGENGAEPEVPRLHFEQLHCQDVARLGALDVDRAGEQVVREVERQQVLMHALRPDLVTRAERCLERDDVAGSDDRNRLDVRVPAVVPVHRQTCISLRCHVTFDRLVRGPIACGGREKMLRRPFRHHSPRRFAQVNSDRRGSPLCCVRDGRRIRPRGRGHGGRPAPDLGARRSRSAASSTPIRRTPAPRRSSRSVARRSSSTTGSDVCGPASRRRSRRRTR